MSSKKLTSCRKVGLSRKTSTGITLGILNETGNNNTTPTPLLEKKSELSQKPRKVDQNLITPCRRVGLSRKRKFSPLYTVDGVANISTPMKEESLVSCTKSDEETIENSDILDKTVIPLQSDKENIINVEKKSISLKGEQNPEDTEKIINKNKVPKIKEKTETEQKTKAKNENLPRKRKFTPLNTVDAVPNISTPMKEGSSVSCTKFDGEIIENSDINETVKPLQASKKSVALKGEQNSEDTRKIINNPVQASKVPKIEVKTKTEQKTKAVRVKNESLDNEVSIAPKKLKYSTKQNTPKTSAIKDATKNLDKMRVDQNFNNSCNGGNQFIKVCYKDEEPSSDSEPLIYKTKKMLFIKKKKLDEDDDDDFETTPLSLSRQTSRTDVTKKEPKKKHTLKKTASNTDIKDCSVKLEKIKDVTLKKTTVEQTSDDDFDTEPPIPKEQVKINIENLEKQIVEKQKLLEELNRAKSMKKLHDVEELKELTTRWKNGCRTALTDLLEVLNQHAFMSMESLVTKFNIPPDFFHLSQ